MWSGSSLSKPTVVWEAPIFDSSCYAEGARNLIENVASVWPLKVVPLRKNSNAFTELVIPEKRLFLEKLINKPVPPSFIHVVHAPGCDLWRNPKSIYSIGRTTFETDRLPHEWIARCNVMDEIWVPSEFNLETFQSSGVHKPIYVVPEGVDTRLFHPGSKPFPIRERNGFAFLSVFEWNYRKGWDILLKAWVNAFGPEDDVCLILKTYPIYAVDDQNCGQDIRSKVEEYISNKLQKDLAEVAPIIVIERHIPPKDMPSLYAAADAFVLPSRGEGWGRTYIEAMACGLPVIGTRWGGHMSYMSDENSFLIDVDGFVEAGKEMEFHFYRGHRWSEPSSEHLQEIMKWIYDHREIARAKGKKAREDVGERWSWEKAASMACRRLESIRRQIYPVTGLPKAVSSSALRIVWEGLHFANHSLAIINREICLRLAKHKDIELSIVPYESVVYKQDPGIRCRELERLIHAPLSGIPDVYIRHRWPPNFSPPPAGRWVMIQPWEYGRIPAPWLPPICALVDKVWVPSRHVLKTYVASGVPPEYLEVIPNGVDTERFCPEAPPFPIPTDAEYRFLFVGGTIWRKGIDTLLKAYCSAFRKGDDVVLIIKDMGGDSFYRGQVASQAIRQLRNREDIPAIIYLDEVIDGEDMPGLYTACDCLVHPYRGEGFGMPVLEAMACELPVIVTAGGATDDFCSPDNAYLIPSRRITLNSSSMEFVGGAGWVLEPDLFSLIGLLRHVYENRSEAKEKGLAGRCKALSYRWDRVVELIVEQLEAICEKPVRRFRPDIGMKNALLHR